MVYCMRRAVEWPGIAGYAAGTTGVYWMRQPTHRVGAEGNGLLYAMSG